MNSTPASRSMRERARPGNFSKTANGSSRIDAGDFPVAGRGVLAGGAFAASGRSWRAICGSRRSVAERLRQAERVKIRQTQIRDSARRMCPSVFAPSSPYFAASGALPMPTLSRTRRSARTQRECEASWAQHVALTEPDRVPRRFHLDGVENPIRIFRVAPRHCAGVRSRRT